MAITADQRYRLHKACLHDEDVRIALAGFLTSHFAQFSIEVDPEIFTLALDAFSLAMSSPDIINKCGDLVATIRAEREAERAERRKDMH